MRKEDKVWLACAVDSEGWIVPYDCGDPNCAKRHNIHYQLGIATKDLKFVQHFRNIIGHDSVHPKPEVGQWSYFLTKTSVLERILKDILPYVITKQGKAQTILTSIANPRKP